MSSVELHLALNHLPVAGFLFAIGLLAMALITKSRDLKSSEWHSHPPRSTMRTTTTDAGVAGDG